MTNPAPDGRRLRLDRMFGQDEHGRQVRVATVIGTLVGLSFAIFNLCTEGMLALGLIELGAVLLLVRPAMVLSLEPARVRLAESLLLLAAMLIFGALIVLGGIEGTGIFWVYTSPFLAFFLKGQRLGWRYSLGFWALASLYLLAMANRLGFSHPYSPVVATHFLLSLGFYTLVAAAFNHVRDRDERQLLRAKEAAELAAEELRQAKEKAEAANAAKSRFLSAASHDLRQPAHALGMFVAQLKHHPGNAVPPELVAGLTASVQALQEMLDVLFDYSRLDALDNEVQLRPVQVASLFEQLALFFDSLAAQKGIRLRIRPTGLWVISDAILLQRILLNLVSNALRYTDHGGILVSCRPTQGGTQARIEVRDTGIGIAPQHHDKIFEDFYQVQNPERQRAKGLGLGLSMVARSCKLLGHPLTVRSTPGQGSCFGLTVALTPAPAASLPTASPESMPSTELNGFHVLLVEDDPLGSTALQGLLQAWACRVTVATDALAACAAMQAGELPDFIVCDYRLPGPHNGIETVRLLREQAGRPLAACLISGDTDTTLPQQAHAAGLVLLKKPVPPAKLRSLLRRAMLARQPDPSHA